MSAVAGQGNGVDDPDVWIAQLMQCKPLSEGEVKRLCDKVSGASVTTSEARSSARDADKETLERRAKRGSRIPRAKERSDDGETPPSDASIPAPQEGSPERAEGRARLLCLVERQRE